MPTEFSFKIELWQFVGELHFNNVGGLEGKAGECHHIIYESSFQDPRLLCQEYSIEATKSIQLSTFQRLDRVYMVNHYMVRRWLEERIPLPKPECYTSWKKSLTIRSGVQCYLRLTSCLHLTNPVAVYHWGRLPHVLHSPSKPHVPYWRRFTASLRTFSFCTICPCQTLHSLEPSAPFCVGEKLPYSNARFNNTTVVGFSSVVGDKTERGTQIR